MKALWFLAGMMVGLMVPGRWSVWALLWWGVMGMACGFWLLVGLARAAKDESSKKQNSI